MSLVTTTCNQCEQNNHLGCPASKLESSGFLNNAGDHCKCAADGHQSPQSDREIPKLKSMLGRQKEPRDEPVDREIVVEDEMEIE